MTSDAAEALQRTLRRMNISIAALLLALVALGVWFYIDTRQRASDIAHVAGQSSTALCALRHDLERRVAAGHEFLKTHPHGIAGISAATLLTQIDGQQRTIDVLAILDCPPEVKP